MALGQRAALATVCLVAAATTAAAVLVMDNIPDAESGPSVALRSATQVVEEASQIETGALPRQSLYPDDAPTSLDQAPPALRFSFIAPDVLPPDEPLPSLARAQSGEAETWATQTHATSPAPSPAPEQVPAPASATKSAQPASSSKPAQTTAASAAIAAVRSGRKPVHKRWFSRALNKRLAEISPAAIKRIEDKFRTAKAAWPPAEIGLVAIKDKKTLELYARADGGKWTFIHSYPVLAASGGAGPKLVRGDKQVPEGVYRISFLNPNSRYHVSMRVNYPNSFDRTMARKDGRKDLGGDIMIHGKRSSAGCLAMGDPAAEELFVLAAEIGLRNIKLVIAPTDFRKTAIPAIEKDQPAWLSKLYIEVASEMAQFKPPAESGGASLLTLLGL